VCNIYSVIIMVAEEEFFQGGVSARDMASAKHEPITVVWGGVQRGPEA